MYGMRQNSPLCSFHLNNRACKKIRNLDGFLITTEFIEYTSIFPNNFQRIPKESQIECICAGRIRGEYQRD